MKKEMTTTTRAKMPKSVLDKIVYAIRNQPLHSSTGGSSGCVSRVAITKYLQSEMGYMNPVALKKAFKKATELGILEQSGQSFRVKGDVVVDSRRPTEAQVEIVNVVDGQADGLTAEFGDTVTVKYVGKLEDGTIFDAESSFEFTLGAGDVIKGWDLGIVGMKVGGTRKLCIPPKLGYGKRGCGPDIPPESTLLFEIDLKKVVKSSP